MERRHPACNERKSAKKSLSGFTLIRRRTLFRIEAMLECRQDACAPVKINLLIRASHLCRQRADFVFVQ